MFNPVGVGCPAFLEKSSNFCLFFRAWAAPRSTIAAFGRT